MFFLAYFLFRNGLIALLAALSFSFFPSFVDASNFPNNYTVSIFFIEFSAILVLLAINLRTKKSLLLMCLVLVFTAIIRIENMLLLVLFTLFILIQKNGDKKRFLYYLLITFLFYIPFILFLFQPSAEGYSSAHDFSFSQLKNISVQSLFYNLYFNLKYMAHFSFWLLSILGFFYIFKNNRINFYFLSSWFLIPFSFYLLFNMAINSYALSRFTFSYIPLCVISAAGIFYLLQKISYIFHDRVRMVILILILLLILFFNINFLIHYVYAQDGLNDPSHNPYLIDIEGFVKPTTDRELTNVTEFRLSPNFESKTGKDLR